MSRPLDVPGKAALANFVKGPLADALAKGLRAHDKSELNWKAPEHYTLKPLDIDDIGRPANKSGRAARGKYGTAVHIWVYAPRGWDYSSGFYGEINKIISNELDKAKHSLKDFPLGIWFSVHNRSDEPLHYSPPWRPENGGWVKDTERWSREDYD
ncbi:Uu.00g094430.m01.CDS01 [Anthostomella pinea]|uniref:Uu.00g094430.m01.CDS01 n=1 Tax=Anthostomella pinea TaxID=933095 RepID=A0AAI8VPB3_9PEZI|nr:Uu.00g094430.m01.CDS01 [Anthostomella pinea]